MYDAHNNVVYKFAINKDVLFKFKGAFDRSSLFTRDALRADRV